MAKKFRILLTIAVALELCGSAFANPPVVPGLHGELGKDPAFAGRVLLSELNCTSCHGGAVVSKGAPDLKGVGGRIHPDYITEFIADPSATKPGTTMPDVLGDRSLEERQRMGQAIAEYLSSQSEEVFGLDAIDTEAADRGRKSFEMVGCAACHAPEGRDIPGSAPLHRLADKYSVTSLTAFLEDPLAVRPGGRMPDLQLTHWEASDIAHHLLRDQSGKKLAARESVISPERVAEGKVLYEKLACAQCHQPAEAETSPVGASVLSELNGTESCGAADYSLSDLQRSQIAAALSFLDDPRDSETEIRLTMTRLNCIACHTRGDIGGHSAERDEFFTSSNINLGEQARIPPTLTHVGAKLTPTALRKTLVGGESIRPYMNMRMPKFGVANVEPLLDLFAKADRLPAAEFEVVKDEKVAREAGQSLVGDKNLSCVACHTFLGKSATTLAGVELTLMTERLQKNWFHLYLANPQEFHPTTIMPSFWPGGKAVRPEVLDGDAGKQIDAIWQYLARGREARTPSGIRREPIEYGPTAGEAVMLRRQYSGIGKRGIGVGYPSGINLSFDAGQMRLGSIWKGDFAEMSGVWRGQGSGNVGERSRELVRFPVGPAFALLESPEADWPVVAEKEKAPGFQFDGYSLDKKQRPTFRYRFADIAITDQLIDEADASGPMLTRTLTFDQPAPEKWYFRAAPINQLVDLRESALKLDKGLWLEFDESPVPIVHGENSRLVFPLAGREKLVLTYRFKP